MQTARSLTDLRAIVAGWRGSGQRIALVPTMGALHEGHLSLIATARRHADRVVASIFVNPTQFGPNEDLDRYPRREQADAALLVEAGCHLLWLPDVAAMYPKGFATSIRVSGVSEGLCGGVRPGHFDGVATVVAKLFNQVLPDVAVFGEKDYQQLAVIRRMAADLDFSLDIIGAPTVREPDGLAMSSRNAYLSKEARETAVVFPRTLRTAVAALQHGNPVAATLDGVRAELSGAGFDAVDYVELRSAEDLQPLTRLDRRARLLAAVRIGGVRLIDNFSVESEQKSAAGA